MSTLLFALTVAAELRVQGRLPTSMRVPGLFALSIVMTVMSSYVSLSMTTLGLRRQCRAKRCTGPGCGVPT